MATGAREARLLIHLASCKESGQVATLASEAQMALLLRMRSSHLVRAGSPWRSRGDVRVKANVCGVRHRIQGPTSAKLMEN